MVSAGDIEMTTSAANGYFLKFSPGENLIRRRTVSRILSAYTHCYRTIFTPRIGYKKCNKTFRVRVENKKFFTHYDSVVVTRR